MRDYSISSEPSSINIPMASTCTSSTQGYPPKVGRELNNKHPNFKTMCLVTKFVPTTLSSALGVPCFKYLETANQSIVYVTPFMQRRVPDDGVLVCRLYGYLRLNSLRTCRLPDFPVQGEGVHSFCKRPRLSGPPSRRIGLPYMCTRKKVIKSAYAFGVISYDDWNELASRALYIPGLDKTPEARERKKFCKDIQTRHRVTIKQVLEVFPEMRDVLKNFYV